jgi:hypothetical protein
MHTIHGCFNAVWERTIVVALTQVIEPRGERAHETDRALLRFAHDRPLRRQKRRQREGDEQREHRRGHDHETVFAEKLSHDAAHERDRSEHDDVDERDRDRSAADFGAADKRGFFRPFAHLSMARDIFNDDDRVVHKDADRQR